MNRAELAEDLASQKQFLALALSQNRLAVFVGAGLSASIGLPSWPRLTELVCLECGVDSDFVGAALKRKDYYSVVKRARDLQPNFTKFQAIVSQYLYSDGPKSVLDYWRSPLFVALGSLLSGGARGRVQEVVSLNFDNILEQYLLFHGYPTQVIVAPQTQLLGGESTHIFHPHGYLPAANTTGRSSRPSKFLLFTRKEADERIGKSSAWKDTLRFILRSKVSLFVGMSEDTARDYVLTTLLNPIHAEAPRRNAIGFWFFKKPVRDGADELLGTYGIHCIQVDDYSDIPLVLLEVCRKAVRYLGSSAP